MEVGDARGGGASSKSMSCAFTRHACDIGQNHSTGVCGSCVGFLATRFGGYGRRRPTLLLKGAMSPHAPLKLVSQRNTPTYLLLFSVLSKIL